MKIGVIIRNVSVLSGLFSIALTESFNTTGCINEFLFTSEERMAVRTDTDLGFLACGPGFPYMSAGANDLGIAILGMYFFFHFAKPCF